MILADKIVDLRKKSGMSQEELAEKLGVSRQAVSKWEGAQAMPDMGRVVQLSELFGVSTDYLLKDAIEKEAPAEGAGEDRRERTLGMEEASAFLQVREENARRVAVGVLLCILSPVALILLGGAQSFGLISLTENQAAGLGLTALLGLIGCAVAIFIKAGLRIKPYEFLQTEPVETLYGVDGMVRDRQEKFRPVYTRYLTVGVVLCVVAVIPLFLSLLFGEKESFLQIAAVGLLLMLIAVGVMLIVRVSMVWGSCQMLLEEGEYTRAEKREAKRRAPIAAIYWALVTAVFLAVSFIGNAWNRTWIIWPVAGVAFAAVMGIVRALHRGEN